MKRRILLLALTAASMLPSAAFAANKGLALGWKGYADTDLKFSEFFNGPFTISFYFMPQYPRGYEGPMIAENGAGTFIIGQDDYRDGDEWQTRLFLQVGAKSLVITPTLPLQPGVWHHVTVTAHNESGGTIQHFTIYLDGSWIGYMTYGTDHIDRPSGTVRFGKRTSGQTVNGRDAQFYGILDDIEVYAYEFSESDIQRSPLIMHQLTGSERGLVAGYTFDGTSQHSTLSRPVKLSSESAALISISRNADDLAAVPLPSTLKWDLTLPFKAGEAWRVTQGYGGTKSHNGYAEFCFDLVLADQSGGVYPFGTLYAPFYAAAPGKVLLVKQDSVSGDQNPANGIVILQAPEEFATYLHLWTNTAMVTLDKQVPRGEELALAGDTGAPLGAYHLHNGFRAIDGPDAVTFPVAYSNYELRDANGVWHRVFRGIPQYDDVIRRPYDPTARYNAIWRPSPSRTGVQEHQMEGGRLGDFIKAYDQIFEEGWRVQRMQAYIQDGVRLYNAVWRRGTTPERQMYGKSYADYKAKYDELWTEGWRLFHLQSYVLNGQVLYDAIWRPGTSAEIQVYGWKDQDFQNKYIAMALQGWRLVILQSYVLNGEVLWNAVWRPGNTGEMTAFGKTFDTFKTKYDLLFSQGWRLSILQTYVLYGEVRYNAVWTPGTSAESYLFGGNYEDFVKNYDEMHAKGWQLELLDADPH